MGHYRSEMGFEESDKKFVEYQAKRYRKMVEIIRNDIADRGIEQVLADIVLDTSGYRMKV